MANVVGPLGSEVTIPQARMAALLDFGLMTLRHEIARTAPDIQVARPLLDFVVRLGGRAPYDGLDTFTNMLVNEPDLRNIVGVSYFAQRISRIDGKASAAYVGTYLLGTPQAADHRWGVRTMGRMEYSEDGASYLVRAMRGTDSPFSEDDRLRGRAVESYTSMASRYSPADAAHKLILGEMRNALGTLPSDAFAEGSDYRAAYTALRTAFGLD
jgi:hypothetical protein